MVFAGMIMAFNLVMNFLFQHNFNDRYHQKISFVQHKKRGTYNTFFIGSSRTYRHVIPALFDSLTSASEQHHSFNLGSPATFVPQTFYLLEELLSDRFLPEDGPVTVFLEMMHPADFTMTNLFTQQSYYWCNWKNLSFLYTYQAAKSKSFMEKAEVISRSFTSGFLHHFGFNFLPSHAELDVNWLGPLRDGYLSLEEEQRSYHGKPNEMDQRRKAFLADPDSLDKRAVNARTAYRRQVISVKPGYSILLQKMQDLIQEAQLKNVRLIFLIPPRLGTPDYDELLYIKSRLPEKNDIELGDPDKYPDFYNKELSFDIGHLNAKGAALYTAALANAYLERWP